MNEIYVCEKTLAKSLGLDEVKVDGVSENLLTYLKLQYSDDVLNHEETIKLLEKTMILNQSELQKYFNSNFLDFPMHLLFCGWRGSNYTRHIKKTSPG